MPDVMDVGSVNAGNQDGMKARQVAEAANRQTQAPVVEVVDGHGEDSPVGDRSNQAELADTGADAAQPRRPTFFGDDVRDQIAANFRRNREARAQVEDKEAAEDAAEIREFIRTGGVPKELTDAFVDDAGLSDSQIAEQEEIAEREATRQAQPEPPRKFKIKVRGGEREVSEEELIALAQKNEAADDYMNEAKTLLNEVKALKRDAESRPSPAATPAADSAATGDQPDRTDDQPQVNRFRDTAETLLYGDPETAGEKLKDLSDRTLSEVPKIVQQTIEADRRRAEHQRSSAAVQRFTKQNEELSKDPRAVAAIEATIYEHQRQDLVDLGMDPNKLPTTLKDIANMHLTLRSDPSTSGRVRTTEQIFDAAKADYLKWRGVETIGDPSRVRTNQQEEPVRQRQEPVVQVTVDRDDRRRAIPQQPTRPALVQRVPQEAPRPRTRSEVIAGMRAARGQV